MIEQAFLRSIHLAADARVPARLAHYQPTHKGLGVLRAVIFGEPSQASMVIATYGSGKSLTAGVGALVVENLPESGAVLGAIVERLKPVDAALANRLDARLASKKRGLVLALHGHVPHLACALAEQAGLAVEGDLAADLGAVLRAMAKAVVGSGGG